MPAVTKDELQQQVALAFGRRHVTVEHPAIIPTDHLGGWRIVELGEYTRAEWTATRPIEMVRQEVEDELGPLYRLVG